MNRSTMTRAAAAIAASGCLLLAGCSAGPATGPAGPGGTGSSAGSPAPVAGSPIKLAASTTTATTTGSDVATITAKGVGKAIGTPDVLTVVMGVETTSDSAQTALADNNARAAALIDTLKKAGVVPADLRTSQLSIYRDTPENKPAAYRVSNMVTATLRKVASAGTVIDEAAKSAGAAVRIHGMSFSFGDDAKVMEVARFDAVSRAREQAMQMADAAGVKLGRIISIVETPDPARPMPMSGGYATAASDAAVPVQAGTQELNVTVQVVWEIAS